MKYVIACTARSGSSWLCTMLRSTGLAGDPREYFCRDWLRGPKAFKMFPDYYKKLQETKPFGVKTSFHDFYHAARVVGEEELAGYKHIWLQRRDTMGQAISHCIAARTGLWSSNQEIVGPEFEQRGDPDEPHVGSVLKLRQIHRIANEFLWPGWFRKHHISPLEVWYEDMCEDPVASVNRVCDFLEVGRPKEIDTSILSIQRDKRNRKWRNTMHAFLATNKISWW